MRPSAELVPMSFSACAWQCSRIWGCIPVSPEPWHGPWAQCWAATQPEGRFLHACLCAAALGPRAEPEQPDPLFSLLVACKGLQLLPCFPCTPAPWEARVRGSSWALRSTAEPPLPSWPSRNQPAFCPEQGLGTRAQSLPIPLLNTLYYGGAINHFAYNSLFPAFWFIAKVLSVSGACPWPPRQRLGKFPVGGTKSHRFHWLSSSGFLPTWVQLPWP